MNESTALTTPRPAGRRRHPEATYRRRRAVVGGVLAALAVGTLAAHDVLAGSGGEPASAAEGQPARVDANGAAVPPTVTAQPGDTLWEIAEQYHGEISMTRYVDKLVDLNGGPSLQAGQLVLLP